MESLQEYLAHRGVGITREEYGYRVRRGAPQDAEYCTFSVRLGGMAGNTVMIGTHNADFLLTASNDTLGAWRDALSAHLADQEEAHD